jgi:hypothetical protein
VANCNPATTIPVVRGSKRPHSRWRCANPLSRRSGSTVTTVADAARYGMELDINPAWVTGVYIYQSAADGIQDSVCTRPTTPYLLPSSRDLYGWYARE